VLKLKAGKQYRMRNGCLTPPLVANPRIISKGAYEPWPWLDNKAEKSTMAWDEKGRSSGDISHGGCACFDKEQTAPFDIVGDETYVEPIRAGSEWSHQGLGGGGPAGCHGGGNGGVGPVQMHPPQAAIPPVLDAALKILRVAWDCVPDGAAGPGEVQFLYNAVMQVLSAAGSCEKQDADRTSRDRDWCTGGF